MWSSGTFYAPGDVVAFDLRIFHASWGGTNDRQMSCVSFFHYPETAEETETMGNIVPGYLTPNPPKDVLGDSP